MRQLGWDYIVDHGSGTIHLHEPHQAVFLSPKGYRHIGVLENKNELEMGDIEFTSLGAKNVFLDQYTKLMSVKSGTITLAPDGRLTIFNGIIMGIRNRVVSDVSFYDCTITNGFYKSCIIMQNSYCSNTRLDNCTIEESVIHKDSKVSNCALSSAFCEESFIDNSNLRNLRVGSCNISNSTLKNMRILQSELTDNSGTDLQIDKSTIHSGDYTNISGKGNKMLGGQITYWGENPISDHQGGDVVPLFN